MRGLVLWQGSQNCPHQAVIRGLVGAVIWLRSAAWKLDPPGLTLNDGPEGTTSAFTLDGSKYDARGDGEADDREGRIGGARGRKGAARGHEEIVDAVDAALGIDDAGLPIGSHACRPDLVVAIYRLPLYRLVPILFRKVVVQVADPRLA